MGWDDRDEREGFWDGRTLGDEPPVNITFSVLLVKNERADERGKFARRI